MKKTLSKQIHSFYYAIRGLLSVFVTEAHMRFHLVAAVYVIYFFEKFYIDTLGSAYITVLILTIACVMVSEVVNTAIERLSDAITTDYNENIKFAKDVAAGAVLLFSFGAISIACYTFLDKAIIFDNIIPYFAAKPASLVLLIASAVVAVLFVAISPKRYLSPLKKLFTKKHN